MMQLIPDISVVMPAYNVEKYIKEAIESILNQSFSNFELIIVDDGSSDGTSRKVESFKDERIIFLQNKSNLGNYPSRNIGIQIAKGKYIAVMDADDIAMPDRLKKQFELMESHPKLVATGTSFQRTHGKVMDIPLYHEEIQISLLQNFIFLHPSFMVKSDILKKLGGYNENYKYASDYNLLCRLCLIGEIQFLPDVLMTYRVRTNQISRLHKLEQARITEHIRQHFQMDFINKYRDKSQEEVTMSVVRVCELGRAISLYTYSRHYKNKKIEEMADHIIDVVCKLLSTDLEVEELCGIGLGFLYLLRNNFVGGDEDDILEEIDDILIKSFRKNTNNKDIFMEYFRKRVSSVQTKRSVQREKITLLLD